MLKTKQDVDRHVRDLLSKLKSDVERKSRGYNIARHYFNIKEYESARRYLSEYIALRPKSAEAHRLLGEIFKGLGLPDKAVQSFKASYDLELSQKDLILKICEIYSEIDCDESTRLYWLEEGERHFPHDEMLVLCKEKLYQRTRSKSKDDLEKLYLDEIQLNPQSEKLPLSLLKLYQEWSSETPSKVGEAYRFVRKTESSGGFVNSAEWYRVVASIIELYEDWKKPHRDKEFEEFALVIMDRLVHHTLSRCSSSSFDLANSLSDAQDALKKLDARLSKASKILSRGSDSLLTHIIGQLFFHMASLLLIRKRSEVLMNTEVPTGALLFHALVKLHPGPETDVDCRAYRETLTGAAALRFSQSGHVLLRLACDNGGHHPFLEKVKEEIGKKECLGGLYTLALGLGSKGASPSFFLTNPDFASIELRYPEKQNLLLWDQEVCLNYCKDLKELLWIFRQNGLSSTSSTLPLKTDFSHLLSLRFFKDLPYSRDVRDVAPETLSHLDLVAFILATAFCIEEKSEKLNQPSLLSGRLHSQGQEEFWNATYALVSNSAHKRMNHLRSILQSGLESIRILGPCVVPLPLATHLARVFTYFITCAKKDGRPDLQVRSLTERAEHYWKRTLSLCDRVGNYSFLLGNNSRSSLFELPRSQATNFDVEEIREEGNYFLAERYITKGRKEEAIQTLLLLKSPQASLKLAMLYKQCAFDNLRQKGSSNVQEDHISNLYKARDTLYLTLDRIRMPGVKVSHAMNQELSDALSQVESALADASVTEGQQDAHHHGEDGCYNTSNLSFNAQVPDLTNGHVSGLGRMPHHSSTPYKEMTPTRTLRRQEARPSPERLDAQVRHLTDVQENTIKTMQDHISALRTQNETLLDTCQTMVAEFKENVAFYKSILEQKKNQAEYFIPINTQLQHVQDMIKDLQIEVRSLGGEIADLRTLRLSEKEDPKQDSLVTETTSQVPLDMSNSAMQGIYNNYHSYYGSVANMGHHHVSNALIPPSALFNTCQPPFIPPSSLQSQPHMSSPGVVKPEASLASSSLYPSSPYQFSASMTAATSGLAFSSAMKTSQGRSAGGAGPAIASAPHAFQITMPPQAALSFNSSMTPGPADSPKPAIATEGLLSNVPAPLYSAVVTQPSPPKASEKNVLVSSLKTTTSTVLPTQSPLPMHTPSEIPVLVATAKEASPSPGMRATTRANAEPIVAVPSPKLEDASSTKDQKPLAAAATTPTAILATSGNSGGKFSFSGFTFSSTPSISPTKTETPPKEVAPQQEPKKESMFANLTFKSIGNSTDGISAEPPKGLIFNLHQSTSTTSDITSGQPPSIFGSTSTAPSSGPLSFGTSVASATSTILSFGSVSSTKEDSTKPLFVTKDEKAFSMRSLFPSNTEGGDSPPKDPGNTSKDEVEEYEPQVDFKPVVPMPALVEVKTGEEEEETMFCERSKLYRYDATAREWKERGIGDLKILKNPTLEKVRILMRRDQTHKVCANHFIASDTTLAPMSSSDRAWVWAASDFADEKVKQEQFAAKFKTPQVAADFHTRLEIAKEYLEICSEAAQRESARDPTADDDASEKPKETRSLVDRFKPAVGSWECPVCLLRNEPSTTNCSACMTSREETKLAAAPTPQVEQRKVTGNLSELFKPSEGSWECHTCLVRNKPTTILCIACDTPKPGSTDSQPDSQTTPFASAGESTFSAPAFKFGSTSDTSAFTFGSAKPAFTFGFQPASTPATSFSFGLPQPPAAVPTISAATTQETKPSKSFSFSWKPPTTTTSTPIPASTNITTVGSGIASPIFPSLGVKTPEKDTSVGGTPTSFGGSRGLFEFNLTPTKGGVVKSPRSRDISACESEEGLVDAGEGDHLYFEPVIALPDKIEVVTGEEEEEVLYTHRAKLYRHVAREWKERGIGNIKILQHKLTKKIRLLMRRENIHKICLNHLLSLELVFAKKDDLSLYWVAKDFAENEPVKETFALRFKTPDIAGGFVQAINDARAMLGGSPLSLDFPKGAAQSPTVKEAQNGATTPISSPVFSAGSPGGSVFGGHRWSSGGTPQLTSSFTLKGSPVGQAVTSPTVISPEKLFGDAAASAKQKPNQISPEVKKSDADTTAEFVMPISEVEVVYERKATEEQVIKARSLKLPDNFFLYETLPPCPGCRGCREDYVHRKKDEDVKVVESSPARSEPLVESFFTPTIGSSKPALVLFNTPLVGDFNTPSSSIFGNTPNFGSMFKGGSIFGNTTITPVAPSPSSAGGSNALFAGVNMSTFQDFAPKAEETLFGQSESKSANSIVWRPRAVFGTPKSPDKEDSVTDDDNYDPHYEPIIAMPDIVEVKTGEEGWQDLFSERSKVFRYDPAGKEWKERGIGNFKVQYEPTSNKYRLLHRREQVHKLSCNHCLSPNIVLTPLMTSEVAWCWSATDFSDNQQGEYMKLAVKFKTKEIADAFKSIVEQCQQRMSLPQESEDPQLQQQQQQQQLTVTATVTTHEEEEEDDGKEEVAEEEDVHDEEDVDDDEDLEDEEDEDHPFFYDSCSLSKQRLHGEWHNLGEVDLRMHYDNDAYGIRVTAVLPTGEMAADHLICIQTVLSTTAATTATWVALDSSESPPTRHWFKATFKSSESLELFMDGFKEGKECAEHGDLEEKAEDVVPPDHHYHSQGYNEDRD